MPDPRCSCGELLVRCPVWSQVLARLSDVDPAQAVRQQRAVVREHRVLRLLRADDRSEWPALDRFAALTARVYQAIAEVTGCPLVVDSSKRPGYGALLRRLPGCELRYLHLVRDPRASAYSWRTRRHQGSKGGQVRQRGSVDATLRWDWLNVGSELVLRAAGESRSRRLRYEDFAASPRPTMEQLCEFLGQPSESLPFTGARTVRFEANHVLAGNPSRLATGTVELRDRREWRHAQRPVDRWLATAVALPFLSRYGYPLRLR